MSLSDNVYVCKKCNTVNVEVAMEIKDLVIPSEIKDLVIPSPHKINNITNSSIPMYYVFASRSGYTIYGNDGFTVDIEGKLSNRIAIDCYNILTKHLEEVYDYEDFTDYEICLGTNCSEILLNLIKILEINGKLSIIFASTVGYAEKQFTCLKDVVVCVKELIGNAREKNIKGDLADYIP